MIEEDRLLSIGRAMFESALGDSARCCFYVRNNILSVPNNQKLQ